MKIAGLKCPTEQNNLNGNSFSSVNVSADLPQCYQETVAFGSEHRLESSAQSALCMTGSKIGSSLVVSEVRRPVLTKLLRYQLSEDCEGE